MSDKLAISATLSVLLMSGYVLLGGDAVRAPLGPQASVPSAMIQGVVPRLPDVGALLPKFR